MTAFKESDMQDAGQPFDQPRTSKKKKHYPSVSLSEKQIKKLKEFDYGDDITIHAHGEITAKSKYNDDPAELTIEMKKVGVKGGHNPYRGVPKRLTPKVDSCVEKLKRSGRKVKNVYAICIASVMRKANKPSWLKSTSKK